MSKKTYFECDDLFSAHLTIIKNKLKLKNNAAVIRKAVALLETALNHSNNSHIVKFTDQATQKIHSYRFD